MIPRHRIWAMMKSGAAAAAVTTYLLNFNWDLADDQGYADAQVLDTAAEGQNADGDAGNLTVRESAGNVVEVVSNELKISGAIGFDEGGVFDPDGQTRTLGMGLIWSSKQSVNNRFGNLSGFGDAAGLLVGNRVYQFGNLDSGSIGVNVFDGAGVALETYVGSAYSADTWYKFAIILGGFDVNGAPFYTGQTKADYTYGAWFVFWNTSNWILEAITSQVNIATLHAGLQLAGIGSDIDVFFDDAKVPDPTSSGGDLSGVMETITNFSSFTAANGTGLDAITPEVGGGWTEQSDNWDIQGNKCSSQNTDNLLSYATVSPGIADCLVNFTWTCGDADNNKAGPILRFTDTDNMWIVLTRENEDNTQLYELNGGSFTSRALSSVTIATSTDYSFVAVADGQDITVYIDGVRLLNYASASFQETATVHGVFAQQNTPSTTPQRYDNFYILPRTHADYDTILDAV